MSEILQDIVTPCHGKPLEASIRENQEWGDTVRIWCAEPTCFNTWDKTGKIEDE